MNVFSFFISLFCLGFFPQSSCIKFPHIQIIDDNTSSFSFNVCPVKRGTLISSLFGATFVLFWDQSAVSMIDGWSHLLLFALQLSWHASLTSALNDHVQVGTVVRNLDMESIGKNSLLRLNSSFLFHFWSFVDKLQFCLT